MRMHCRKNVKRRSRKRLRHEISNTVGKIDKCNDNKEEGKNMLNKE